MNVVGFQEKLSDLHGKQEVEREAMKERVAHMSQQVCGPLGGLGGWGGVARGRVGGGKRGWTNEIENEKVFIKFNLQYADVYCSIRANQ